MQNPIVTEIHFLNCNILKKRSFSKDRFVKNGKILSEGKVGRKIVFVFFFVSRSFVSMNHRESENTRGTLTNSQVFGFFSHINIVSSLFDLRKFPH